MGFLLGFRKFTPAKIFRKVPLVFTSFGSMDAQEWVSEELCGITSCVTLTAISNGNIYLSCRKLGLWKWNITTNTTERFRMASSLIASRRFNTRGIVWDRNNYLYICDYHYHCVLRFDITCETISVLVGTGTQGYQDGDFENAQFTWPCGIAIDKYGILYVTDDHHVRKIDTEKRTVETVAGSSTIQGGYQDGEALTAKFHDPSAIAISDDGTLYVMDSGNGYIREIKNGIVSTVSEKLRENYYKRVMCGPCTLVLNKDTLLFAADEEEIRKLDLQTRSISSPPEFELQFKSHFRPSCIWTNGGDLFYVATQSHLFQVVNQWAIQKCLWVAILKEDATTCPMACLPRDIVRVILSYVTIRTFHFKWKPS